PNRLFWEEPVQHMRPFGRWAFGAFLVAIFAACSAPLPQEEVPTPTPGVRFLMPTPGTPLTPRVQAPTVGMMTYIVREGDTLSAIAEEFGVSLDALIEANKDRLKDPNQLRVGQELRIPVTPLPTSPPQVTPTP
ncbi:MAG: LysM peptidoglycan-binding domain-containing protein, partial [Chloroflexia bacterium]